jgi:hypothetical protein
MEKYVIENLSDLFALIKPNKINDGTVRGIRPPTSSLPIRWLYILLNFIIVYFSLQIKTLLLFYYLSIFIFFT